MDFYRVPNNIFNPISDRGLCDGRIVLPIDAKGELKDQLESAGYTDIIRANDTCDHLDIKWWKALPEFDWTIAITQGLKNNLEWILEPGYELANKGLIVLDRITFLEPTRARSDFLKSKPLSNMIVLNPRPEFRADQRKSKDSVTSAWFVYDKTKNQTIGTNIYFDVSWQRPKSFFKK